MMMMIDRFISLVHNYHKLKRHQPTEWSFYPHPTNFATAQLLSLDSCICIYIILSRYQRITEDRQISLKGVTASFNKLVPAVSIFGRDSASINDRGVLYWYCHRNPLTLTFYLPRRMSHNKFFGGSMSVVQGWEIPGSSKVHPFQRPSISFRHRHLLTSVCVW